MRLLISGYGGASGQTAGIYDCDEKRFIWESGIPSISFMCFGDGGRVLFGAGEHDGYGKVYMFRLEDAGYRLADTLDIPGGSLCYIAWSPLNKLLTGACYGSGDIFAIPVEADGFGTMNSYIRQCDNGESEDKLTRAHCTVWSADERFLYAANIALDRIYRYEITAGKLHECSFVQLDKGVGPRHILPFGDMLYVITEYSNEIILLRLDAKNHFVQESRISTLPNDFEGISYCSTLCYWEQKTDGAGYIYAANRGANTIVVFKHMSNGEMTKLSDCPCDGDWPRHIAMVQVTGESQIPVLAITNEKSGYVSLCRLNPEDGVLYGEPERIPFEGASFVCQLDTVGTPI